MASSGNQDQGARSICKCADDRDLLTRFLCIYFTFVCVCTSVASVTLLFIGRECEEMHRRKNSEIVTEKKIGGNFLAIFCVLNSYFRERQSFTPRPVINGVAVEHAMVRFIISRVHSILWRNGHACTNSL